MRPSFILKLLTIRQKKNGKYPVKVRIIYRGDYHDYKTGIDLTVEEFEQANIDKPRLPYRSIAVALSKMKARVDEIITSLPVFTFQKFEDAYYDKANKPTDFYSIFQKYIDSLLSESRIGTANSYSNALQSFKEFKKSISFHDIDANFLKKYQEHCLIKGRSLTTVGIYVRSLRTIYNYGISEGIIKRDENYPFSKRKYIIPAGRNIKKALTSDELKKIFNFNTIPGTYIDRAKDFWTFSYLCNGINFKDIALLKNNNIDGEMLRYIRQKTVLSGQGNKKIISCYLTKESVAIIEKWRNKESNSSNYIFGIIIENDSPQKKASKIKQFVKNTNLNMKKICFEVGIDKNVTTYHARHSSATILKKSGASIAQIQEALGHSSPAVTQGYLDSFDDNAKKELAKSLVNF